MSENLMGNIGNSGVTKETDIKSILPSSEASPSKKDLDSTLRDYTSGINKLSTSDALPSHKMDGYVSTIKAETTKIMGPEFAKDKSELNMDDIKKDLNKSRGLKGKFVAILNKLKGK